MKRASVGILALLCLYATIIARPSTRASAGAVAQIAADVQKLDAADVQRLDAATAFVRERNARDYAIAPDGIAERRYVMIGGIEQWITIRGDDRRNPVLLFLHGGPGDTTTPWGYEVSIVAEGLHGRSVGSARRGQHARKKRTVGGSDDHDRSLDSGRNRARRDAPPNPAEGQDHPRRSFLGFDSSCLHGEGAA